MNSKLLKALSDLKSNPRRTLTVILALVLGMWGVGTVLISYVILIRDLDANYQSTTPANVVFRAESFDSLNMEQFNKLAEVENAELRDFSLERIEVYPDQWIPFWLYGVEDIQNPQLAKVFNEQGSMVPEKGTILMERDGLQVSDITLGSSPRIRVGSKLMNVKVSGICFDPAQAPATQDAFIYAYTDKDTFHEITGLPLNQRLIVRLNNVFTREDVESVSRILAKQLETGGIKLTSIEIPKFNEHPHQWQLDTLLLLIGSIGFLAFVMGSVLVSQLMRSVLASQIRQIGVLKAIGATRWQVFQIYLFMLLLIGAVSGLIAIPLAVLTGKAFSAFVAFKLNFNILTTVLPLHLYGSLILASLLLPILLSLSILFRGTRVSVRSALSDYGIIATSGRKILASSGNSKISFAFVLSVRNAFRNVKRLTVTILTMALGVAIFSTGFNVRQSLWNLLSGLKKELGYDVQVVFNKPISRAEAIAPFQKLDNVKETEMWSGGRGEIQTKVISADNGVGIVALPVKTKLLKLKIGNGRWVRDSDTQEIVMNQMAWAYYHNPKVGSDIDIVVNNHPIKMKLVGIAEQFDKPKLYINIGTYDELFNPEHKINSLVFVAKDNSYDQVMTLKKDIESAISSSDLGVLYVMSQAERVKIVYDHLNIILSVIVILSFLVLVVSAVGMASATGINIWERTREIGVIRAMGASPTRVYSLFVYEGMIVSVLSILLGVILSYPLSQIAAKFFGTLMLGEGSALQYAFSIIGFWTTLIVTLLFGWLASRLPAKSAIKVSTYQALSYE